MIQNLTLTLLFAALCCTPAHAVSFDWATVGDPGNANDIHGDGYGGVDDVYRISKHEVTDELSRPRGWRGGSWDDVCTFLLASEHYGNPPNFEHKALGFA